MDIIIKMMKLKYTLLLISFLVGLYTKGQTQRGNDIPGTTGTQFGYAGSMGDENTFAVGARYADPGVKTDAGEVTIWEWSGNEWGQKGITLVGETAGDLFGSSVFMPDANTLAVGAPENADGKVYVYEWNGSSWVRKGDGSILIAEGNNDGFGQAITMPHADTLAVGASKNIGGGSQGSNRGHVRVFTYSGGAWSQLGNDIDGDQNDQVTGKSVSMPNGTTVAVGAPGNKSNNPGHVRIYTLNGSTWTQKGSDILGPSNASRAGEEHSLFMPDANTVGVGAPEFSPTGASKGGQVRIYKYYSSSGVLDWNQVYSLDGATTDGLLGQEVFMPHPDSLVVGERGHSSGQGRVRLYANNGSTWNLVGNAVTGAASSDSLGYATSMANGETFVTTAFGGDYARVYDIKTVWDGSSWTFGEPKTTGSTNGAIIASSTAPASFTCDDLLIKNGFSLNTSGITVTINKDVTNLGNGFSGTGSIIFDGSTELTGNAISFEGDITVNSGKTLTTTNDSLTLNASSASSYGMIDVKGTLTGNIIVEQYIDLPALDGGYDDRWNDIAANVTGVELQDWNEGQTMVAANSAQGTVWYWNASTAGYDAPSALTETPTLGRGYAIYAGTSQYGTFLRSGDGPIDLTGTLNTTNVPITLEYNNGQSSSYFQGETQVKSEGWNMLGNPFAAAYDWGSQVLTNAPDVNNAIYIWDGAIQQYASWSPGGATNGGTRYIAPGQAFWIQTTNSTTPGTLSLSASNVTVNQRPEFFKTNPDAIRLTAKEEGATIGDETVVGFSAQATYGFDSGFDAWKRWNGASVPNFYTELSNDESYSIYFKKAYGTSDSVPLALAYSKQGVKMTISADVSDLQEYSYVELRDVKTGINTDLKAQPSYQFSMDTSWVEGRFSLHFDNHNVGSSEPDQLQPRWFVYYKTGQPMLKIDKRLLGKRLELRNSAGVLLDNKKLEHLDVPVLENQPNGLYFISIKGTAQQIQKVIKRK